MKIGSAKTAPVVAAQADKLRKRERAAMAMAYAMAFESDAFSIAFDIKPKVVRTIIYFQQPSRVAKEEPQSEDDGDDEDDDMGEHAPAPAPAERERAPAPPPAPKPKPSRKAGKESTTPAKGASTGTSKGASTGTPKGDKVDKNALSARAGSPKGSQGLSLADRLDALDARDDALSQGACDGKAKKPRREACYPPWQPPMLKANRGPPPPDPQRHGTYVSAKEAGLEYGNPLRLVWVRTADRKMWEVDAHDGDHLGGFHVARGDNG